MTWFMRDRRRHRPRASSHPEIFRDERPRHLPSWRGHHRPLTMIAKPLAVGDRRQAGPGRGCGTSLVNGCTCAPTHLRYRREAPYPLLLQRLSRRCSGCTDDRREDGPSSAVRHRQAHVFTVVTTSTQTGSADTPVRDGPAIPARQSREWPRRGQDERQPDPDAGTGRGFIRVQQDSCPVAVSVFQLPVLALFSSYELVDHGKQATGNGNGTDTVNGNVTGDW